MKLFKQTTAVEKITLTIVQLRQDLFTELDVLEAAKARAAALRAKIERYKVMIESEEEIENYQIGF